MFTCVCTTTSRPTVPTVSVAEQLYMHAKNGSMLSNPLQVHHTKIIKGTARRDYSGMNPLQVHHTNKSQRHGQSRLLRNSSAAPVVAVTIVHRETPSSNIGALRSVYLIVSVLFVEL